MEYQVTVIGAGLAGCECAWQLAERGIKVRLFEMKPNKKTPAHVSNDFAELVCSNSLKAARHDSAAGLLKEEMELLGHSFYVFLEAKTNTVQVLYARNDGDLGLIEPEI